MIECAFSGRLGRDPEHRRVKGGELPMLSFALVVETKAGDQWVRVALFGDRADELAAGLKKGDRAYVEGRLTLESWTAADGAVKSGLSVVATLVQPLGKIGRQRPRQARDNGGGGRHQDGSAPSRRPAGGLPEQHWQAPLDDGVSDLWRNGQ